MENLYLIFGLKNFASIEDVKKTRNEIINQFHNDKVENLQLASPIHEFLQQHVKKVLEAFEILGNAEKKQKHDAELKKYLNLEKESEAKNERIAFLEKNNTDLKTQETKNQERMSGLEKENEAKSKKIAFLEKNNSINKGLILAGGGLAAFLIILAFTTKK